MTTRAQVRKTALTLPETEEFAEDRRPAFRVRGEVFVRFVAGADGRDEVQFVLPTSLMSQVLDDLPGGRQAATGDGSATFAIALAEVNGQSTNYLTRQAWSHAAPAELSEPVEKQSSVAAGEVGDLPKSIGRPATRALSGAGITSLQSVSEHSADELLALHGLGPRAVRLLEESLAARGLALR